MDKPAKHQLTLKMIDPEMIDEDDLQDTLHLLKIDWKHEKFDGGRWFSFTSIHGFSLMRMLSEHWEIFSMDHQYPTPVNFEIEFYKNYEVIK